MRTETIGPYKRVILLPGEFFVSSKPIVISTLLGSCVAACLYDPQQKIIGMNHFLISGKGPLLATPICLSEAGRYGIHAMELLINEMMNQGARRDNLRAKVFGGSALSGTHQHSVYRVGENNSRFVIEFLTMENIPIEATDLGGTHGRVLHFCHGDFSVYVRKIRSDHHDHLARRDRQCWIDALRRQDSGESSVELWE
jgi:chemotaxis protein CheD